MTSLEDALKAVVNVLVQHQIPYAVMGGLAVRLYAIPRFTNDVDLTISIARDKLVLLFDSLRKINCEIPSPFDQGWLDSVAGFPFFKVDFVHDDRTIEIDIFISETDFQDSLIRRRREIETPVGTITFVSPEDLILLKLIASRPRDLIDVQEVFFTLGQLDIAYLKEWASRLSIKDALQTALDQAT